MNVSVSGGTASLPLVRSVFLALFAIIICCISPAASAADFETKAKFAIVMDSKSGKVLFEKSADELVPPASMSKIMTMLLVFEKLKAGRLKMSDTFRISENAWRKGGAPSGSSTMYAELNSEVALSDLIQGVIVQSGNDAAIALAEGIAGSEERYAEDMTKRARELGLEKSVFKNVTGLPADGHVSTMRELASLTRYLIEVFPEQYKYYSQKEFTWNKITQRNRNPLIGNYRGADGVKTGFIRQSGYALIGSAIRDGRRLIVVASGMRSKNERAAEVKKLLDFGFRQFRPVRLYEAGDTIGKARVWGGEVSTVWVITKDDIVALLSEEEQNTSEARFVYNGPLQAPVRAGARIGEVRIYSKGRFVSKSPVYAKESVSETDSLWRRALDSALFMALGG